MKTIKDVDCDLQADPATIRAYEVEMSRSYQNLADRLLPGQAQQRRREEAARVAVASADFLSPDWSEIALDSVMTVREAAALSSGIHRKYANLLGHAEIGVDLSPIIAKASRRLEYLGLKCDITPNERILVERLLSIGRAVHWELPAELLTLDDAANCQTAGVGAATAQQEGSFSASSQSNATWGLKSPVRFQGYGRPLYELLKTAHSNCGAFPTPHDVLTAWSQKQPIGITNVTGISFTYTRTNGREAKADHDAIRKSIERMTTKPAA